MIFFPNTKKQYSSHSHSAGYARHEKVGTLRWKMLSLRRENTIEVPYEIFLKIDCLHAYANVVVFAFRVCVQWRNVLAARRVHIGWEWGREVVAWSWRRSERERNGKWHTREKFIYFIHSRRKNYFLIEGTSNDSEPAMRISRQKIWHRNISGAERVLPFSIADNMSVHNFTIKLQQSNEPINKPPSFSCSCASIDHEFMNEIRNRE